MTNLDQAARLLQDADAILIGAGAGLSAAAGLDYSDNAVFARRYPAMVRYGFRNQYQLIGYPFPDEALKWGYLSVGLDHVYRQGPTLVYKALHDLVAGSEHFVMTSNVDRYFHKAGFEEDRVFTPQGDYALAQCLGPCHQAVWDLRPAVAAMVGAVDPQSQLVTDRELLPVCPQCGGPVFMNVRGGHWFVEAPYHTQAKRLGHWLEQHRDVRLVVLEIGAGFSTPGVIRRPMEAVAEHHPNAQLIRINRDHSDGPAGSVSIPLDAGEALTRLNALG